MSIRQRLSVLVGGMMALLLLAACGGGSGSGDQPPAAEDTEAPVQVVREFVAATQAKDVNKLLSLIEPSNAVQGMGAELRAQTGLIGQLDYQNETYTLEEHTGQEAKVRFTADVTFAVQGAEPVSQAAEMVFNLVKVNESWYIRNVVPVIEND
ncbi:MAG: hypothetical protein HC884_13075 [Chloroflexaceae bacterium]|nr:hypothetical protein [Chloroflexaceae bacterium]